ncbi:transposase family protein [Streptomyces sp. SCSIO 30461]|uniref:transposase family protein n=1 Tax=Streptomyces sp. SCSIO 30461 TaxID=3118085 RepID=UPI0030D34E4B
MLVYPAGIDVSSSALRFLSARLRAHRRERGARWRRLTTGRQALLALAPLRCGHTYAQLAAGFGVGQGAGGAVRVPFRGRWERLSAGQQAVNIAHARIRALGERGMATLKTWRLLRKLRCSTNHITRLVQAILTLHLNCTD